MTQVGWVDSGVRPGTASCSEAHIHCMFGTSCRTFAPLLAVSQLGLLAFQKSGILLARKATGSKDLNPDTPCPTAP